MISTLLFQAAQAEFADEIAALLFEGTVVTGRHRLVSIDLARAKVLFRKHPSKKPFCYLALPTRGGPGYADAVTRILMHPKLKGVLSIGTMEDLTATLWAYTNIRISGHPIDLRSIDLSPEAAAFLENYDVGSGKRCTPL